MVRRKLAERAEAVATLNTDGFAWMAAADTGTFGKILNPLEIGRAPPRDDLLEALRWPCTMTGSHSLWEETKPAPSGCPPHGAKCLA